MNLQTIINADDVGGLRRNYTGHALGELGESTTEFRSARGWDPPPGSIKPSPSSRLPPPPPPLHPASTNPKPDSAAQKETPRPTKRRKIAATSSTDGSPLLPPPPKANGNRNRKRQPVGGPVAADKSRLSPSKPPVGSGSGANVPTSAVGKRRRRQPQQPHDALLNVPSPGNTKGKAPRTKSQTSPRGRTKTHTHVGPPRSSASASPASPSEAQHVLRLARETAQSESLASLGHTHPFIMDVILDSQPQVTQYSEDVLMDALEARHRSRSFSLGFTTQHDLDAYWAEQSASPGHSVGKAFERVKPKEIYRVSAERSTATWDSALDPDPDPVPASPLQRLSIQDVEHSHDDKEGTLITHSHPQVDTEDFSLGRYQDSGGGDQDHSDSAGSGRG